jgi:TonB family protein
MVSMMVDPQGKPFEVGVVASSGNKTFEHLAVEAMEKATFTPGALNNEPIESVYEVRYTFTEHVGSLVRREFVNTYAAFQHALDANDQAAAQAALQQLPITTLYEDAFYGLAVYQYAERWGDERQQAAGLERATAGAESLNHDVRQSVLLSNFKLQAHMHDYWKALELGRQLQKMGDKVVVAQVDPIIEKMNAIRTSPASYDMTGVIEDVGNWSVQLFKKQFRASPSGGVISLVKLRCARGFVSFPFDPELQYTVPDKYGQCRLSLEGTPGTQITLTQS